MKVFLTGASSGIGEALARHYAGTGAVVGLFARRAASLQALQRSLPGASEIYPGDVRDLAAVSVAAEDFMARHGLPDIVIGNAGISYGTLTERPEDAKVFRDIIETNVLGLLHTFQPFVKPMRERRAGCLVGIASVAGFRGLPGASAYSASKAAAIRYLEALRVELHGTGVQVTTICPGFIETPMTARNPYRMPFILTAEQAARRFARVIAARKSYAIVPWQMAIVGRLLPWVPNALYDAVASRRRRKPRKAD
ncbi:MAG: SDR family oxidoreductase [Betaproteobacteria bacterium]